MSPPYTPPIERVLRRIGGMPETDACILWPGSRNPVTGYGRIATHRGEGGTTVHVVVFEHYFGPVPEGMVVDHTCHNADPLCPGGGTCYHRACLNPRHLEAALRGENERRGRNARTGTCRSGRHRWTGEHRQCPECKRARR